MVRLPAEDRKLVENFVAIEHERTASTIDGVQPLPRQITPKSTRQFPRNNAPLNMPRSHEKPWRGTRLSSFAGQFSTDLLFKPGQRRSDR